jgi:ribA/ribD-fused uncharacterized protein
MDGASSAPPPPPTGQLCRHCGARPCHEEPDGTIHPFCGKRCADAARAAAAAAGRGGRGGGGARPGMCIVCGVKPVYVEAGRRHDYCGKACRDQAARGAAPARTVPLDQRGPRARLPNEIKFYEREEDFYEFTNFWECDRLVIDGKPWRTAEHYFQAMKFAGFPELLEQCRNLATPRECFDMARNPAYAQYLRKDWHRGYPNHPGDITIKDQVMHNAVMHKFTQDPDLNALLLSTATGGVNRMIVEHTEKDSYWGDGGVRDWRVGQPGNELGQLLVRIRGEIARNSLSQFSIPHPPAA